MTLIEARDPLQGLTVLERGWLSSNNVLIHPAPGEPGVVLVDTSHVNHAAQTCALVARELARLGGAPLAAIVNTHLHSDHCGGNAALQAAHGAPILVAPGMAEAVRRWDMGRLSYLSTGQRCARFEAAGELSPDQPLVAGGRHWEVMPAPGHDPDSVILFDREQGVLISADALWGNGFGVVFPEIVGEPGFDDVQAVLDLIGRLPVRVVIPGHGAPFTDVADALARARRRLDGHRADPVRHARHALKVLIKYHLMEVQRQPRAALLDWAAETPMLRALWDRHGRVLAASPRQWGEQAVDELLASGALLAEDPGPGEAGGPVIVDAG